MGCRVLLLEKVQLVVRGGSLTKMTRMGRARPNVIFKPINTIFYTGKFRRIRNYLL